MPTFNLIDQPWIRARTLDGELVTLTMQETLLRGQQLRRLEDASPLVLAALHRFILAVLHRALEGPTTSEDTARWFREGFPAKRLTGYLTHWRDRFDLFHPAQPFFQVPGLEQAAKPKAWTMLLAEEGSFNTRRLFNPSNREGYAPAPAKPDQAARALLAYQTFALGGLMHVFSTSAPAGPVAKAAVVVVLGETLHDTLCLNLVPYADPARDIPIWERDGVLTVRHMQREPEERARGHVQGYTWPNRSVLLLPALEQNQTVVRYILLGAGIRMRESEAYRRDPMVAYRYDEKNGLRPLRFSLERAFWRDFDALLPRKTSGKDVAPEVVAHAHDVYRALGRRGRPLTTVVCGLSSDQAKIECWRTEHFELPPAIIAGGDVYDSIKRALTDVEEAGRWLSGATRTLAEALLTHGGRQPSPQDRQNVVRSLPGLAHYWSTLQRAFTAFLGSLTPAADPEEVAAHWRAEIYRTLQSAWRLTTRAAGVAAPALRGVARAERALGPHLAELYKSMRAIQDAR